MGLESISNANDPFSDDKMMSFLEAIESGSDSSAVHMFEWVQIKSTDSAEVLEKLGPAGVAKAQAQGIEKLLLPVPKEEVAEANEADMSRYFIKTSRQLFGADEAIREIQEQNLPFYNPEIDELEDLSQHEFVRIKPELWVGVINRVALEIIMKNKPKEKTDGSKNESKHLDHEIERTEPRTEAATLKNHTVTKKNYAPLRNTMLQVSQLSNAIAKNITKERDSTDAKRADAAQSNEENRALTHEAQGRGGTPEDKAKADLTPVKEIHNAEGAVEKRQRHDRKVN